MARKPTKVSLRARQRNLIEGRATKGLTNKQLANQLAVSQADLSRFMQASPKQVKRSPRLYAVYEKAMRPKVREALGTPIRRYISSPTKIERLAKDKSLIRKYEDVVPVGYEIMSVMHPSSLRSHNWAVGIAERGLPVSSWTTLKTMHDEGRLSEEDWDYVNELFDEVYGEEAAA